MQVGIVLRDLAPQVIAHRHTDLEVISAQEVIADAISGTDESNVAIIEIDVRATLYTVRARAVVGRLQLGRKSQYGPVLGQIGLE